MSDTPTRLPVIELDEADIISVDSLVELDGSERTEFELVFDLDDADLLDLAMDPELAKPARARRLRRSPVVGPRPAPNPARPAPIPARPAPIPARPAPIPARPAPPPLPPLPPTFQAKTPEHDPAVDPALAAAFGPAVDSAPAPTPTGTTASVNLATWVMYAAFALVSGLISHALIS